MNTEVDQSDRKSETMILHARKQGGTQALEKLHIIYP